MPAAGALTEQHTAGEVTHRAPPTAQQQRDAGDDGAGEESHDGMAGAAVMHVHPDKHGYNIITPATECVGDCSAWLVMRGGLSRLV
jgi:hypothetical protein